MRMALKAPRASKQRPRRPAPAVRDRARLRCYGGIPARVSKRIRHGDMEDTGFRTTVPLALFGQGPAFVRIRAGTDFPEMRADLREIVGRVTAPLAATAPSAVSGAAR